MVVTCALDNRQSFNNLRNWMNSIRENSTNDDLPIILIANKSDLVDNREVQKHELQALANEWKIEFYETSAMSGTNIEPAFDKLINKIYNTIYKKDQGFSVNSSSEVKPKEKCCK